MNEKELTELLKYSSPRELYVVTNLLQILSCPLKVKALQPIGNLKKGQIVWVDEIKVTLEELKTVYIIKEKAYYYYHFDIIIEEKTK